MDDGVVEWVIEEVVERVVGGGIEGVVGGGIEGVVWESPEISCNCRRKQWL